MTADSPTPKELVEEWESGERGLRPARVKEVREAIIEYTGLPVPRRRVQIETWLDVVLEMEMFVERMKESPKYPDGEE